MKYKNRVICGICVVIDLELSSISSPNRKCITMHVILSYGKISLNHILCFRNGISGVNSNFMTHTSSWNRKHHCIIARNHKFLNFEAVKDKPQGQLFCHDGAYALKGQFLLFRIESSSKSQFSPRESGKNVVTSWQFKYDCEIRNCSVKNFSIYIWLIK